MRIPHVLNCCAHTRSWSPRTACTKQLNEQVLSGTHSRDMVISLAREGLPFTSVL